MPDISAFAGALSSLKAAKDIAEAMIGLRDAQAFQSKLLEFQRKLIDANDSTLAAQQERAALLDRVSTLEKEVTNLKGWEAEKQRYELKEVASGANAYVVKESMHGAEPAHWLCANCFENGEKRFLQAHRNDVSYIYHRCQGCGGEIRILKPPPPPRQTRANTRYDPLKGYR
jgi:hypothetical protein